MADAKKFTGKLNGQRVLIIGGTSGIGFGVAEALIENGVEVIISSSSAEKVKNSVSRLESSYPSVKGKVQGFTCNLATQDAPTEVANLFSKVGTLDHVVYTAGDSLAIKPLEEWSLADMQQAGMVRFFGAGLVAQQLRKHLKPGPHSSFTLTTGGVADKPMKDWWMINGYATGLYGLMRGLALDLAPIRVNIVTPGAVDTELWDPMRKGENFGAIIKHFKDGGLTGEIGSVDDLAETYLYLMKDKNVTGSIVKSDSGAGLK